MKAVVVRAPMEYGVEDVPTPEAPDGGILIRVQACGLCGSDLRTLRSGHRKVTFPWIIGHEISGTVVGLGTGYTGPWGLGEFLAIGPVAYCGKCSFCLEGRFELCENYLEIGQAWPGGFAEYMAIPEQCIILGSILSASKGMDPAYAAITEPISSCVNAQEKAMVGLGDTVVIIGSGPVGCIHASLARSRGAERILIADILDSRLKLAEAFEPDRVINAAQCDVVEEVLRLTDGRGAEIVITANPSPAACVQAVEMARKGGRILIFGGLPKDSSKPGVDMNRVHYNALHLMGTTIFGPRHQRIALKLASSGRIPLDKLITHRFSLSDFEKGVHLAMAGKVLKGVIIPS